VHTTTAVIDVASEVSLNDVRRGVQQTKYALPALVVVCKGANGVNQTFYVLEDAAKQALNATKGHNLFRVLNVVQSATELPHIEGGKVNLSTAMTACSALLEKAKNAMAFDKKLLCKMQKMLGHDLYIPADYTQMINSPLLKSGTHFLGTTCFAFKLVSYGDATVQMLTEHKVSKACEISGSIVGGSVSASMASTALVWASRLFGRPLSWGGKAVCVAAPYIAGYAGASAGDKLGEMAGATLDNKDTRQKIVTVAQAVVDVKGTFDTAVGRNMAISELQEKQNARYHAMMIGNQLVVMDGMNPFSAQDVNAWMAEHAGSKDAKDVAAQVALIRSNYAPMDKVVFGALEACHTCSQELKTPMRIGLKPPPASPNRQVLH
jgi:hypothetical protein